MHTNDPVADFLLGLDSSYFQNSTERRGYFHYRQFEPYFQDDWKVTPRLTLNLGLRYVYISPDTMDGDGVSSFDANRFDPGQAAAVNQNGTFVTNSASQVITASGQPANLNNGVILAGKNGVPRGFFKLGSAISRRASVSLGIRSGTARLRFAAATGLVTAAYLSTITWRSGIRLLWMR